MNQPRTPREFFSISEYEACQLVVAGGISIFVGDRNIGKTTGSFIEWLFRSNPENMIFYGRNTLKEIESYRKTFNATFSGQFVMSLTEIYSLKAEVWINKKTKAEETRYVKDATIGFVGALNGTDGWRSANFDKVKFIYFDEFNQIGNSLDTQKFLTLWTSIVRTRTDVYTVIIGNRDDAAADLIVELGIDINVPQDHHGDWIVKINPHDPTFQDKMFFIDLDPQRFGNWHKATSWKSLGNLTSIKDYFNRGYKTYENADCFKLAEHVLNQVDWSWTYDYGKGRLAGGKLLETTIIHYDQTKIINNVNLKLASLTESVKLAQSSPLLAHANYIHTFITSAIKNENILYTSILAKQDCHLLIDMLTPHILKESFKL